MNITVIHPDDPMGPPLYEGSHPETVLVPGTYAAILEVDAQITVTANGHYISSVEIPGQTGEEGGAMGPLHLASAT